MKGDKNMEKKPIKVSFGTVITIIIAVIILIGCGGILYKNNIKIDQLEEKIAKQEDSKANIENNKENIVENTQVNQEKINQENKDSKIDKFVIPSLFTSNAKKLNESVENVKYGLSVSDSERNFIINVENGIPTITTTLDTSKIKEIGFDVSKIKMDKTYKKISGFNKKVVDICTVFDEHQFMNCTFLFLMEDGTVEYSTLQNLINNLSSEGKIKQLNNIVRLQKVELQNSNWSDSSAIAIDKDNNYYDVSEYIK